MDNNAVDKILNLTDVKIYIVKEIRDSDGKLDKTELINQLKTILLKSWNDKSIMDKVVYKAKKDIK